MVVAVAVRASMWSQAGTERGEAHSQHQVVNMLSPSGAATVSHCTCCSKVLCHHKLKPPSVSSSTKNGQFPSEAFSIETMILHGPSIVHVDSSGRIPSAANPSKTHATGNQRQNDCTERRNSGERFR